MTRKHFDAIAASMLFARPSPAGAVLTQSERAALAAWGTACSALAAALAQQNPRFNRARFLAACGLVNG